MKLETSGTQEPAEQRVQKYDVASAFLLMFAVTLNAFQIIWMVNW